MSIHYKNGDQLQEFASKVEFDDSTRVLTINGTEHTVGFAEGGISLSDVQATIFDFGDGDLSAFGWEGEITYQNLVNAGIKSDIGIVEKQPVSIRIGNSVAGIGDHAFYNCSRLTSVTILGGVTSIGFGAFNSCTGLTSMTIPDCVASIGNRAFFGCSGLSSITIGDGMTHIEDFAFNCCTNLKSVMIPNGVTNVGEQVFGNCGGLTNVTISNGSIGKWTFLDCSSLMSVTIGNSVTSIGQNAFYDCSRLTEVKVEGKTQAEAEALLANAGVPAGCQIKTWNFEPKLDYTIKVVQQLPSNPDNDTFYFVTGETE